MGGSAPTLHRRKNKRVWTRLPKGVLSERTSFSQLKNSKADIDAALGIPVELDNRLGDGRKSCRPLIGPFRARS